MKNINLLIIHLLAIIHIFIWIYVVFCGIISEKQNNIILYIVLPLIYIIHLLPFHIIGKSKDILADNITNNNNSESSNLITNITNFYKIPMYFENLKSLFNHSFCNPLSPQGLIILSFIINIYLHKYKYNYN